MDEVRDTRESVLITKRGRAVAKLVPVQKTTGRFLGRRKGIVRIVGDIESSIEPPHSWEARW